MNGHCVAGHLGTQRISLSLPLWHLLTLPLYSLSRRVSSLMELEGSLLRALNPTSKPHHPFHFHLSSLSAARSLLLNPSTPIATVHSTVQSLLLSLPQLSGNPSISLTLALSILAQSASLHPSLSQSIISAIRSLINGQDRTSSAAVSALLSIARSSPQVGFPSVLASVLDENLVLSLASSGVHKVRSTILNLLVFTVGRWKGSGEILSDEVMVKVLLGFTRDIYPVLRRNAIDCLCEFLTVGGGGMPLCAAECCVERAVDLMEDDDELVRAAAIRMLGFCGEVFVEKAVDKSEQIDAIFTQICCMARDMSVKVRIEAFKALGKVKLVSDSVLMQSLSKKILGSKKGGSSLIKLNNNSKLSFSCAAGAFIHGVEDEFFEVRKAACGSLGTFSMLSIKFSDDAINLLMDLMNDDAEVVLLEALNSLFHIAAQEHLNIHEKHMQMFLGLLTNASALVRHGTRKTLRLMKFRKLEMFKSTVNELIANLGKYTEEEEDIFFALFSLGKNHPRFSLNLAKDLAKQIKQTNKVDLALDKPSVAATLVVCIASTLSENEAASDTPAVLFSYSIPLLGRISRALQGTIDQDFLLNFLLDHSNIKWKSEDLMSEIESNGIDEGLESIIDFIYNSIGDAWSLIKHGNNAETILRYCTKELEMISLDASQSAGPTLDFLSTYVQILQLISEICYKFDPRNSTTFPITNHHILLEKLDSSLRMIRYSFTGWSKEIECHMLELSLLSDVFALAFAGTRSDIYLKNLCAKISHLESMSCLSDFTKEVKRSIEVRSSGTVNLHDLLEQLEFRELESVREMKSIKAELKVVGNDSENPLAFVPGLPVGIKFCITLHNTSSTDRFWLRMSVSGGPTQYVFIDFCNFEGSEEVRKCTGVIPFYGAPKVALFEIRVSVVVECLSEYYQIFKERDGGPRCEVTELSAESLVYFSSVKNI